MADILVTGGSGFLGSHAADRLTEAGHRVRLFDRSPSPYLRDGQDMVIGDIMDAAALREAASGCAAVYHFAAIADLGEAHSDPAATAQINVIGTVNVLTAAADAGVDRFLFASSVYALSRAGSYYGASKQAAERFIECFGRERGLAYTNIRYGSLYGRRAGPTNLIHRLVRSALTERNIVYKGQPDAVREYIHVADAADLSLKLLDPSYANRNVVLTGTERLCVRDVVALIAELVPGPIDTTFLPGDQATHYHITPYSFNPQATTPQIGHKLVKNDFVDLGQGILDVCHEVADLLAAEGADAPAAQAAGDRT